MEILYQSFLSDDKDYFSVRIWGTINFLTKVFGRKINHKDTENTEKKDNESILDGFILVVPQPSSRLTRQAISASRMRDGNIKHYISIFESLL